MFKLTRNILDRLVSRYRVPDLKQSQGDLGVWLTSVFGESVYFAESLVCSRDVCKTPGYRAAQLSISSAHSLLGALPHKHKFILASAADKNAACICDYHALPLPGNALDAILLHHVLDFSPEPHQLLKEAARSVSDGGYLIIVGFDPFSFFGAAKWLAGLVTRQQVWRHNSLRRARLIDWLQLLGFQTVAMERGQAQTIDKASQLSVAGASMEWLRRRISAGAFYVVVARKQAIPTNPIRPTVWQAVKVPGFAGLETTRRHDERD